MSKKYFITWLKATLMRTIRTMAQSALATIGATALITDVDWKVVLSATLMAGVACIITCIAGLPEVKIPTLTVEEPEADAETESRTDVEATEAETLGTTEVKDNE